MKKAIILAITVVFGLTTQAQKTLKEALYGGRLKSDTGTVVRKTDDLSTKIDTTRKLPDTVAIVKQVSPFSDTMTMEEKVEVAAAQSKEISRSNTTNWKDFVEQLKTDLQTEVLPNKKIKEGTYSILINYEIEINGQVSVVSVSSEPANSFLENQVKERIIYGAPVLTPSVGANGKPRVAAKKQTIILVK